MGDQDRDRNLNATCEEYHSEDSEDHVLESFRRSPNSANVAAKRSGGGLGSEKAAEKVTVNDLRSEVSGYTSNTAATMNSTDTTSSGKTSASKSTAPSSTASIPPPSPAATKRRPTIVTEDRKHSSQSSPRKPLQRSGSVSSRRPAGTRRPTAEDCTDPTCTKCGPNALHSRGGRRAGSSLDYPPLDQRSQRSDPAPYTSPPSPTYSRQPAPYAQGPAVVQPAQSHRRSSSTARRPMSYHGEPGQAYWTPGMPAPYPSPPQEQHGPPSMTARYMPHPQMPPYNMLGATPPAYYAHGQPMAQASPPYEPQRPPLSARGSSQSSYQTRPQGRPQSGYGPTLITQERNDKQPMPSARFHNAPPSATQERFPQAQLEYDSSEYDSSSEEEEVPRSRSDRALMPPPKITSGSKERRPSLRHANTTQIYNERRQSMSQVLPERTKVRDPRASQVRTAAPSRAPSMSRPALTQHATYDNPRSAKVVVENSSSRRRQSYQAGKTYDQTYDQAYDKDYLAEQKRRNRDSKIYQQDRDDAIVVSERERPRRRTDAATTRRSEYRVEDKGRRTVNDAEAYQQRMRGSNDPLTDAAYKAAKRASNVPSDEVRSNRSDDRKSRVSQAKTTVTNGGGNGEIRLRVDASAPLSLSFNGDMEGRTLQINPAEGGMADIVIGSSRDSESVYRSEKGSTLGNRRPLIAGSARRDAEEASVRSARSSQSRREGERRVLRRRTEYN